MVYKRGGVCGVRKEIKSNPACTTHLPNHGSGVAACEQAGEGVGREEMEMDRQSSQATI